MSESARTTERPFFATAAKGTEGALRDELRGMRVAAVRATRGGVHFGGDLSHAMRACLRSHTASRVLWQLAEFDADTGERLYEGARQVEWTRFLGPERTLAVSATVKNGALTHTGFVAQKTKDAIVDAIRDAEGERPDVERSDPDVRVAVHIDADRARLYVDLAGAPLSKRGYRLDGAGAPMRENLAASMLKLAGYQAGDALLDPMCGSGTIAIEAALMSAGIAPGAGRRFGFMRWRTFDDTAKAAWETELERAERFAERTDAQVLASDRAEDAVSAVKRNAARAGVDIAIRRCPLSQIEPPPMGAWVVTNPPYGVRLRDDQRWQREFAGVLEVLSDCNVVVITPDQKLPRALGIPADAEHTLYNGDLECRMFTWKKAD